MASPLAAWTTRDQRAGAVAKAKASQPVRKAATRSTSKATFVLAPALIKGICMAPRPSCAQRHDLGVLVDVAAAAQRGRGSRHQARGDRKAEHEHQAMLERR